MLGRKFLMLTAGRRRGRWSPAAIIPLEPHHVARSTSPTPSSDLSTTVEEIDDEQLAKSFTVLADTFRDTPDEVRASLEGLSRLSRTIASRDAELKALLDRSAASARCSPSATRT